MFKGFFLLKVFLKITENSLKGINLRPPGLLGLNKHIASRMHLKDT